MQKLITILGFILVMVSCKSTQNNSRIYASEPSWVTKSPIANGYYVGVFGVQKGNSNFRDAAKKGALDNLSSEISVKVSGESILNTIEKNGDFNQEFQQNVKITSKEDIEGFELVDNWESETEYWVYYRLSKAKHAAIKEEKLNAAMNLSKELFSKAKVKHVESNYQQAFLLCIQSLEAVSGYFDKPMKTTFEGKEIYLGTEVFSFLQEMVSEVKIESPFQNKEVKLGEDLTGHSIYVLLKGKNGALINGIPVKSEYKAVFTKVFRINSDLNGKAELPLGKINQSQKTQSLISIVDFYRLAEEVTKDRIVLSLIKYLPASEVKATLTVLPPKVYVVSKEKEFNRKVQSKLSSTVKQYLMSNGFEVSNSKSDADLILNINGNSESTGLEGRVNVVYFKGSIEVFDQKSNQMVFSEMIPEKKGLHVDRFRASSDAYGKADDFLKRRIIPKLANQYFSF